MEPAGQLQHYVGGLLCRRIIPNKRRQVLAYRGQVAGTYQILRLPVGIRVLPTGGENSLSTLSASCRPWGLRISSPPVIAPVNINHHLLSPGVLAADAGRGAAIAVTM